MTLNITSYPLHLLIGRVELPDTMLDGTLMRSQIDALNLHKEDTTIPLNGFVTAFEEISYLSGNHTVAWDVGTTYKLGELGEVGDVIGAAPTLGEALRAFVRGFETLQTGAHVSLEIEGDVASFKYHILDHKIWPRRKDAELTLGIVAMVIRRYCGLDWRPDAIGYEHDQDQCSDALAARIRKSSFFNQETNTIVFDAGLLNHRLTHKSRDEFVKKSQKLNQTVLNIHKNQNVKTRVKLAIMQNLGSTEMNQTSIAQQLGVSRRTLRRRLVDEGINFQSIVDECRIKSAHAYLVRTEHSLCDIALKLGYSDQTAFSRAFSRWFGSTPNAIRASSCEVSRDAN